MRYKILDITKGSYAELNDQLRLSGQILSPLEFDKICEEVILYTSKEFFFCVFPQSLSARSTIYVH